MKKYSRPCRGGSIDGKHLTYWIPFLKVPIRIESVMNLSGSGSVTRTTLPVAVYRFNLETKIWEYNDR